MKFYTKQHLFYCGVDLHADTMYVCVLDATGEVVLHRNIAPRPKAFLRLIKPYRDDLVVGCECNWRQTHRGELDSSGRNTLGRSARRRPHQSDTVRQPVGFDWRSAPLP